MLLPFAVHNETAVLLRCVAHRAAILLLRISARNDMPTPLLVPCRAWGGAWQAGVEWDGVVGVAWVGAGAVGCYGAKWGEGRWRVLVFGGGAMVRRVVARGAQLAVNLFRFNRNKQANKQRNKQSRWYAKRSQGGSNSRP